ncbi:hypothetical protein ABZ912_42550 [Nonomuraea angiospora]|uniref:hypothetical protein n=1 Tax=Nonomuraea angiospora TaxID=46172 RepID=UPI00340B75D9
MVTEQDMEQARQALAAANTHMQEETEFSAGDHGGLRLTLARQWQREAQTELDRLTAQADLEREEAERPGREKDAAPVVKQAVKDLAASGERVRRAVEAAQTALVELLDAGRDHDTLVAHLAADLAGRGLKLDDGADRQTGGKVQRSLDGGGSGAVRLAGAWHLGVDPIGVLAWTVARVETARTGRPFPVGFRPYHGRADGLLAGIAAVPAVDVPRLVLRVARPTPRQPRPSRGRA